MIESNNINKGIDKISESMDDAKTSMMADSTYANTQQMNLDLPVSESAFTGEEVKTAGIKEDLIRSIVKKALPSEKRIVPAEIKASKPTYSKPVENEKKVTEEIKPENVPQEEPTPLKVEPASEKELKETLDRRQELIDDGVPFEAPSPTPIQKAEGVFQGKLNTTFVDDDELRATIKANADVLAKDSKVKKTTLAELKQAMIDDGIPKAEAERRLAGLDMTAKIGDYDLTKKIMAVRDEYNQRALKIDEMMQKASTEGLTDIEKYNLLVDMKTNAVLFDEMTGAAREVGTALNAFKDIRNLGPNVDLNDIQKVLDENLSEDALKRLTKLYNQSTSRKAKNQLINDQRGNFIKLADSAYYTFMSNLLSSPTTWMDNFVGSSLHGVLISAEDMIAVTVGKTRRKISKTLKRETDVPEDIVEYDDVVTGLHAFWAGMKDGLDGAAHVLKTGDRAGYKGESRMRSPITADNLIPSKELKVKNPFTEMTYNFNTSKLKDTFVGKFIDGMGFIQSIPMRALAAGDEIVGNTMARMALHREAAKFVRNETKRLRAEGVSDQEIRKRLVKEVSDFVETQPGEIYTGTKEVKDMIQFTYKWDKTHRADRVYSKINDGLNHPSIRFFTPFANTLTKIVDQSASRIPGMNFISPQFYKDVQQGGKYLDRAISRLMLGGTGMGLAYYSASEGKLTGSGPTDFTQRQALMKTGWQPYSLVFDMDELSDAQVKELKKLTDVSIGEGKYYVSYQRFDMMAQVMAMGADLNDALRFSRESPTAEPYQELMMAYATSSAEFMSNLPVMQFVGEMHALSGGYYEDKGDRIVDLFQRMIIQGGQAAALSIPGVGMTQSTLANQIAKTLDKEQTVKGPDEFQMGHDILSSAALDKLKNKVYSRIPVLRGELDLELDNAGRPIYSQNTVHQHWINVVPSVRMSSASRSPMDEVLADYYHGISQPAKSWDGVELSGLQYNNFKKLYGQQIKLPVVDENGQEVTQNMEKAIVTRVRAIEAEYDAAGEYLPYGDVRDEINRVVSYYRQEAKKRMLGEQLSEDFGIPLYSGKWIDEDGMEQDAIHPELVEGINKYKQFKRYSKNP